MSVAVTGALLAGLSALAAPSAHAADGLATVTTSIQGKRLPSRMGRAPHAGLRVTTTRVSTSTGSIATPRSTTTTTGVVDALRFDRAAIMGLPMSGSAWTALKAVADGDLGTPDLVDQDSRTAGRTFGAALVYVRTADPSYRAKVVAELQALPTLTLTGARVLSVARQLAGYVAAADLVGYRDPAFVDFVSRMRTHDLGNHGRWRTLTQTSTDTANNWGAWALASRVAASLYVGDRADVDASTRVFRGFLGDRLAYAGFRPTADLDPSWVCGDPAAWVPINPVGCGGRDGALVEDTSRSAGAYPTVDDAGRTYSWEVLGGAMLTADLLSRNGFPDVHEWSARALLRAAEFLSRNGGYAPLYSTNQYIPWQVRKAYGVSLGPMNAAGLGRQHGFTDWLQ